MMTARAQSTRGRGGATRLGFACPAFNRRGHDILSIRDSRAAEAAAFQLTKEGIADNNHTARWLAERGFSRPVVIGHSNGGMLAVKHVADHPETRAMVLLSAHGGGRDGVQRTSHAGMLAGDRLDEITAQARALVAAGRGRELMLVPGWWYVISAESFFDRLLESDAYSDVADYRIQPADDILANNASGGRSVAAPRRRAAFKERWTGCVPGRPVPPV